MLHLEAAAVTGWSTEPIAGGSECREAFEARQVGQSCPGKAGPYVKVCI